MVASFGCYPSLLLTQGEFSHTVVIMFVVARLARVCDWLIVVIIIIISMLYIYIFINRTCALYVILWG